MENIITTYAPETDMTFILEDDDRHTKVVGWYYGTPDTAWTKSYIGKLEAVYMDETAISDRMEVTF